MKTKKIFLLSFFVLSILFILENSKANPPFDALNCNIECDEDSLYSESQSFTDDSTEVWYSTRNCVGFLEIRIDSISVTGDMIGEDIDDIFQSIMNHILANNPMNFSLDNDIDGFEWVINKKSCWAFTDTNETSIMPCLNSPCCYTLLSGIEDSCGNKAQFTNIINRIVDCPNGVINQYDSTKVCESICNFDIIQPSYPTESLPD